MSQEPKKNKTEVLSIEIIIDSNSLYNATERENFFRGYINNIPGCTVVSTNVEDAEVIDL